MGTTTKNTTADLDPQKALRRPREGTIFDQLVSTVKRNWTKHNTLIAFSADHGAHNTEPGTRNSKGKFLLGDHGTDSPRDLNILHYMGVVLRRK